MLNRLAHIGALTNAIMITTTVGTTICTQAPVREEQIQTVVFRRDLKAVHRLCQLSFLEQHRVPAPTREPPTFDHHWFLRDRIFRDSLLRDRLLRDRLLRYRVLRYRLLRYRVLRHWMFRNFARYVRTVLESSNRGQTWRITMIFPCKARGEMNVLIDSTTDPFRTNPLVGNRTDLMMNSEATKDGRRMDFKIRMNVLTSLA
jgi:hypothetical protein